MTTARPLDGTIVIELAGWIAGPSTTALLSDWGAEVWKVEPPRGDPFRHVNSAQGYGKEIGNAPFTMDNRGKRSVALDLRDATAREALERLLARADAFVTNLRVTALDRLGLSYADVSTRHPHLVYGLVTGYGSVGPDRFRPGYDVGAFGSRTGVLHQMRAGQSPPVPLPLGFGDHVVALSAAAGVLAALVARQRTGEGQLVETSLMRSGVFTLGWEVGVQLLLGRVPGTPPRHESKTPMVNSYRSGDDKWFWLMGVEPDRHFPPVVEALQSPHLLSDPRFATARDRRRNAPELIAELDAAFARHPLDHWAAQFAEHRVWWEPVCTPAELVADPQAIAAGCFLDVDGESAATVAGPVDFAGHRATVVDPAPEVGADTVDVLRSAGCSEAVIAQLNPHAGAHAHGVPQP